MRVLITGASGFLGRGLQASLTQAGHEIVSLSRSNSGRAGCYCWNWEQSALDPRALNQVDAVINLAGANIASGRWTKEQKQLLWDSRIESAQLLVRSILERSIRPQIVLTASAVGWYGERGQELVDELAAPGSGFLAELCQAWEGCFLPLSAAGITVTQLRLGAVLGTGGGLLARVLPFFRLGLGGKLGSGSQLFSWITFEDAVRAALFLLERKLSGPFNLTAPGYVTNAEFTKQLAHALSRPAPVTLPVGLLRFAWGEMADEVLLTSVAAVPKRLLEAGFSFLAPEIASALPALFRPAEKVIEVGR